MSAEFVAKARWAITRHKDGFYSLAPVVPRWCGFLVVNCYGDLVVPDFPAALYSMHGVVRLDYYGAPVFSNLTNRP